MPAIFERDAAFSADEDAIVLCGKRPETPALADFLDTSYA